MADVEDPTIKLLRAAHEAGGTIKIPAAEFHAKFEEAKFFHDTLERRLVVFVPGLGGPASVSLTSAGKKLLGVSEPSFLAKLFGKR